LSSSVSTEEYLMFAAITNNPDWSFALSLVALILGVVVVVQSRLVAIAGWGIIAAGLAGTLAWWPT
jgi:O-antigen ligase